MKNIVFDFGGVVFNWQPPALLRRVLPHRTPDEASVDALIAGFFEGYRGDWGAFDRGTIEVAELAPRIAARTGLPLPEVHAVIDAVPDELQPQRGTVDLMQRLHAKGHAIYFLSNMPAPYADHLERSHGFFACFTDGVFSSRVKLIKPEPAIFELATRQFGIDPAQTVFVDDLASNVEMARSLGWNAVQFIDAAQCEAELLALL